MKFLLPVGGIVDERFGILTTPGHNGVPAGIIGGMDWAVDGGCIDGPDFVKRVDFEKMYKWLREKMSSYFFKCIFVAGGDYVGDARSTYDAFPEFRDKFTGWPLAYCAQDGQENIGLPAFGWDCLFVGGSTEWKASQAAVSVIERAQKRGKHIHIGRVNWKKRYDFFRRLQGSEHFTCDGTRTRFDGTEKTVRAWAGYQAQRGLFDSVPDGDCGG